MNSKFLSRSNDVLRKILNDEKNLDIVKDFAEAVLGEEIIEIHLSPFLGHNEDCLMKEENCGIVNVKVKTSNHNMFNLGIQIVDGRFIQGKIYMYTSYLHECQGNDVKNTKSINILNGEYFNSPTYHKVTYFKVEEKLIEHLELHTLELPKFFRNCIYDKMDAWMTYLKGDNQKLVEEAKTKYPLINRLDELLNQYWLDEEI